MKISFREYTKADHEACMDLFDSNCPPFFDSSERELFDNWLTGIDIGRYARENIKVSHFYVVENEQGIIACGGFYLLTDSPFARLSWGMVDRKMHKKGIGTEFFRYRLEEQKKKYPNIKMALDTSQHTFRFYEKMGFAVKKITPDGYGAGLDKYDME